MMKYNAKAKKSSISTLMMHEIQTHFKTSNHAGRNIMADLTLFDVVFHWLRPCADYENTSTQSHLRGLNMENSRGGGDGRGILESLDFIKVGRIQKRARRRLPDGDTKSATGDKDDHSSSRISRACCNFHLISPDDC